ncbi:uncharacterized protein LOC131614017 [Vicia villosa]|uniref:uncharacterized protein LOC131614017 n=1 Tax=Vicia villosa TaxID=3911 RepID=UPI00273B2A3F|nr:uncharacterized protein LOC131614017 [Vicia villosa]
MIVVSYNIRGGGSRIKRKRVGFLIQKEDTDVCFIQESKLKEVDIGVVKELWGKDNVEWSSSDAIGASGGMLIMWRKDLFCLIFSFKGIGFIGMGVSWKGSLIYFVNVYASCDLSIRRRTWRRLVEIKNSFPVGSWCVGGDFNSVTHVDERVGCCNRNYSNDINCFRSFVENLDLVEPPTSGASSLG